jgi:hypothetical protein
VAECALGKRKRGIVCDAAVDSARREHVADVCGMPRARNGDANARWKQATESAVLVTAAIVQQSRDIVSVVRIPGVGAGADKLKVTQCGGARQTPRRARRFPRYIVTRQ